jgi:hypothetical protein
MSKYGIMLCVGFIMLVISVMSGVGKERMDHKAKAADLEAEPVYENKLVTIEGTGCNYMEIKISDTNEFQYDYDPNLYVVDVSDKDGMIYIKASICKDAKPTYEEKVKIYLPADLGFSKLKVIANEAGIGIVGMNKPMEVINNQGAIAMEVPGDISNDISYTGNNGAAEITIASQSKKGGFTFCLKQKKSAVSLPLEFIGYSETLEKYEYISGNGLAKINVDITAGALSVALLN